MAAVSLLIFSAAAAGFAAAVGGAICRWTGFDQPHANPYTLHAMTAFGGGLLLSAVAFGLTPAAMRGLTPIWLAVTFLCGGVVFYGLDRILAKRGGQHAQFLAMLLDALPEALAMGALFSTAPSVGLLLATFVGLQNLPEGFNAYRELRMSGLSGKRTQQLLMSIKVLVPAVTWLGFTVLDSHPALTAGVMSACGGGLVYLLFQDIAPESKWRGHWSPALGAVVGFAVGMACAQALHV